MPLAVAALTELEQFFAHSRDVARFWVKRFSKCNGHAIRNFLRPLGEEFSALKRKDRSPKPIEPNRNDLGARMLRDQFVAAPQTQQRSRARELAFRKKTNDLASVKLLGCSANCRTRMPNVDRNATNSPQKRAEHRLMIKFLVDDGTTGTGTGGLQDEGVDPS